MSADTPYLKRLKPLSDSCMRASLIDAYEKGDTTTMQELAMTHYRLVFQIAFEYSRRYEDIDQSDILSAGFLGLYKSVENAVLWWKQGRNITWSVIAGIWIRGRIRDYCRKHTRRNGPLGPIEELDFHGTDDWAAKDDADDNRVQVEKLLHRLPIEQQELVKSYYGIGRERRTKYELAESYGCSDTTIERRVKSAVSALRISVGCGV